jgi:anti-anti-sigma factor
MTLTSSPLTPSLEQKGDTLVLKGDISFDTVVDLLQKGISLINNLKTIHVDLGGLNQSDSSGLALCTAWIRAARQQKKDLLFLNTPSFMKDLMRIHELDSILPTEGSTQ